VRVGRELPASTRCALTPTASRTKSGGLSGGRTSPCRKFFADRARPRLSPSPVRWGFVVGAPAWRRRGAPPTITIGSFWFVVLGWYALRATLTVFAGVEPATFRPWPGLPRLSPRRLYAHAQQAPDLLDQGLLIFHPRPHQRHSAEHAP
jgi:hypothetical protein